MKPITDFSADLNLLAPLKFLGSEGHVASSLNVKWGFGIGQGFIIKYFGRAVNALLPPFNYTVFWFDEEETNEII